MMPPERRDAASHLSERLYRALLLAYPKGFRETYGPHMAQVFGDLCREERRRGRTAALAKLWARTLVDLATTAVAQRKSEEEVTMGSYRLAGLGLVFVLAPLLFVSASLLKYGLGIGFMFDPLEALLSEPGRRDIFNLISPVVFLGGLFVVLALNLWAILRLSVGREDGAVVSTVRLEVKYANLAVILVSCALLVTLVGYAFLENFTYRY